MKLRFEVPRKVFLYGFSVGHPELRIDILGTQVLDDGRLVTELEMVGDDLADRTPELAKHPDVREVTRLGDLGLQCRYRLLADVPSYLRLADEHEVLLRFPRTVQDGFYTCECIAPVSELRALVRQLRRLSRRVEVLAFGRSRMRSTAPTLTGRQRSLFRQAVAAGYFDVPRRVSLTGLARQLGLSKSAVSAGLARVEKKLAESSLAESG